MSASSPLPAIPSLNLAFPESQRHEDLTPPRKTKERLRKTPRPGSRVDDTQHIDTNSSAGTLEKLASAYHLSPRGSQSQIPTPKPPETLKPYSSEPSTSAHTSKKSSPRVTSPKVTFSSFSAYVDSFLESLHLPVAQKKPATAFRLPIPTFSRKGSKDMGPPLVDPMMATFSRFISSHCLDALAEFYKLGHEEASPLLAPYQVNVKKFAEWLNTNTSKRHASQSKVSTISNDTARCISSLKAASFTPNSFNSTYSQDKHMLFSREKTALRGWMFQLFDLPPDQTASAISQLRFIAEPLVLKTFEYHPNLKNEAGEVFHLSLLSKIHPSEFLRSFSNAASFILTTDANPTPVEISPASFNSLGKLILTLDQIFDGAFSAHNEVYSTPSSTLLSMLLLSLDQASDKAFMGLHEVCSSSSSLTEEMLNALISGNFSGDDFHLLTPEEKAALFKSSSEERIRQDEIRERKKEAFREEYPVLSEQISDLLFELFRIEEPHFSNIVKELCACFEQNPSNALELRRLFFTLHANYQKEGAKTPKTHVQFQELPLDVAIKKLFPNKRKEIIHLLQLLSINAFKVADLLFKEEFSAFKTYFSLHNSERKMQYKLHCKGYNKWSVSLTKWVDITASNSYSPSSSSSSSSSSSPSKRTLGTMSYSLHLEVDPFSEGDQKVSSCNLKVDGLHFYPGDETANEHISTLAMIFCFGRSFDRISNKRLARHPGI